ncbi:MAG TPA: UDP-N-acetylglucosamine 2-epimerase (non-hydrolyzing) [Allosphingosinicella sp.]|nr:UDP-N-acetylglucosamine 2-epimerase (non-hydrolyzing) [Allosphingosinicella sp.]
MKLLSIFGTRPEAVKLAPILIALKGETSIMSQVCVTAQHRGLLDQVLDYFRIRPDHDLALMERDQTLNALVSRAIGRIDHVLAEAAPDRVLVQGDTSTALAAALAAFNRRIPVAHVEAGLRTYCVNAPFPEEMNRRAIALAADLHFAPTPMARANLVGERLRGDVYVTGNTGIDALHHVLAQPERERGLPPLDPAKKLILVTCHRRESFGAPFAAICAALERLAARDDIEVVFPRHPNPALDGAAPVNVRLLDPLDLPAFITLLDRADLVLTDSGGVQEEAAALGTPAVILRKASDRPESLAEGAVLAGTDPDRIVRAAEVRLDGSFPPLAPSLAYGDGRAAQRIVDVLLGRPIEEFEPARDRMRQIG